MKVLLLMTILWHGSSITAVKNEYSSIDDCKSDIKTIVSENPKFEQVKSKKFQCVKVMK